MPQADNGVQINDFAGLVRNADPGDVDDGAATDQTNCTSISPGELQVRLGLIPVSFEAV